LASSHPFPSQVKKIGVLNHKHLSLVYDRKGNGVCGRIEKLLRALREETQKLSGQSTQQHADLLAEVDRTAVTTTGTLGALRPAPAAARHLGPASTPTATAEAPAEAAAAAVRRENEELRTRLRRLQKAAAIDAGRAAIHAARKQQLDEALGALLRVRNELAETRAALEVTNAAASESLPTSAHATPRATFGDLSPSVDAVSAD
jgi:hypothetical protein